MGKKAGIIIVERKKEELKLLKYSSSSTEIEIIIKIYNKNFLFTF